MMPPPCPDHDHHHGHEHDASHGAEHGEFAGQRLRWSGAAVGMALHSLADGAAMAASVQAEEELAGARRWPVWRRSSSFFFTSPSTR